jgi:hypothetical protein
MSSGLGSDEDDCSLSEEENRSRTCPSSFTESGKDGWLQQGHELLVVNAVALDAAWERFSSSFDGNDDEDAPARADRISKAWWKSIPFMRSLR